MALKFDFRFTTGNGLKSDVAACLEGANAFISQDHRDHSIGTIAGRRGASKTSQAVPGRLGKAGGSISRAGPDSPMRDYDIFGSMAELMRRTGCAAVAVLTDTEARRVDPAFRAVAQPPLTFRTAADKKF